MFRYLSLPFRSTQYAQFRSLAFQQRSFALTPFSLCPVQAKEQIKIVNAQGKEITVSPLEKFSNLEGLPEWLSVGLQQSGFPSTTGIQKYTIPVLEEGHDLIGLAPTGSGKTVAFAVPALKHIKKNDSGLPSVLVLAPTRELVQQTTKVFMQLSCGAVRVCEAYGGASRDAQARRLHMGCDVLVACPGRLKDFLDAGDVSLNNLSFLVFDEADRLLDMGFKPQLDDILSYCKDKSKVQSMMWSATWPEEVQGLANDFLSEDRMMIRSGTTDMGLQVNENITQEIIYAESFPERIEKLIQMIEGGKIDDTKDKLIIFVERQSDTEEVCRALSQRLGIDTRYVGMIHGGLSQRQRDSVMYKFKNSHIRLLVATDVASRGLDIPDVTFVINFQAPKNIDSYCHRVGRTGRAGRKGTSCTFIGRGDGGISGELIEYLEKCKMQVPDELKGLNQKFNENHRQKRQSNNSRGRYGNNNNRYNRNNQHNSRGGGGYRGGNNYRDGNYERSDRNYSRQSSSYNDRNRHSNSNSYQTRDQDLSFDGENSGW